MEICTKFENLKPLLIQKQELDESTFSLVFIADKLTAHDVVALRTANKWCDVLIAVYLGEKFPTNQQKILKDSGVEIFLSCSQKAPKLSLDSGKINSGFVLKTILAVMPSAVAVQVANLDLLKVILQINDSYKDMFTPIYSETPTHILSETEQGVRQTLISIQEVITSGEKDISIITTKFNSILHSDFNIAGTANFLDSKGNNIKEQLKSGIIFLQTEVLIDDITVQDGIQISI